MKSNRPTLFECPINGKSGNNWPKRKIPYYSLNFGLSGASCKADCCNIFCFFTRFIRVVSTSPLLEIFRLEDEDDYENEI